jgi:hypothetical protein
MSRRARIYSGRSTAGTYGTPIQYSSLLLTPAKKPCQEAATCGQRRKALRCLASSFCLISICTGRVDACLRWRSALLRELREPLLCLARNAREIAPRIQPCTRRVPNQRPDPRAAAPLRRPVCESSGCRN